MSNHLNENKLLINKSRVLPRVFKKINYFEFLDLSKDDFIKNINKFLPIKINNIQYITESIFKKYPYVGKSEINIILLEFFKVMRQFLFQGKAIEIDHLFHEMKLNIRGNKKRYLIDIGVITMNTNNIFTLGTNLENLDAEDVDFDEMTEDEIKNQLTSFSNEKLSDIVVMNRYLGLYEEISIASMKELSTRRENGDNFGYEEYIDKQFNALPKLNFSIPNLQSFLKK